MAAAKLNKSYNIHFVRFLNLSHVWEDFSYYVILYAILKLCREENS